MENIETHIENENWEEAVRFLNLNNNLEGIDFWYLFSLRTGYLTNYDPVKLNLVNFFIENTIRIGFKPYNIPQAVSVQDYSVVTKLLEDGHDVDETEFRDATGLTIAVLQNDLEMVKFLTDKGANNYFEDIDGKKAIDYAVEDSEIYNILKSSGVLSRKETEEIMEDYYSAVDFSNDLRSIQIEFMKGAENGDLELIKEALRKPKGMWVLNGNWPVNGKTALHLATEKNRIEICGYLIEKGLDIYKPDHNGETPYDIAKRLNLKEILNIMNNGNG